jgi:hypothetical protein
MPKAAIMKLLQTQFDWVSSWTVPESYILHPLAPASPECNILSFAIFLSNNFAKLSTKVNHSIVNSYQKSSIYVTWLRFQIISVIFSLKQFYLGLYQVHI